MKILKRTQFGDPILRMKAKKVSAKEISSQAFKKLIKEMFHTMHESTGVGLAAPQIGKPLSLSVIEINKSKVRPRVTPLNQTVIINPQIKESSAKMVSDWEGCLSLDGVRGLVPRHQSVVVEFTDVSGIKQTLKLKGFQARVFQHEIDHLNGVLYVDRMKDMKTLMTTDEFEKRIIKKGLKSK
jgi:peptide deformylase